MQVVIVMIAQQAAYPCARVGDEKNLKCVDAQLKKDVRGAFTALSSARKS